MRVLRTIILFSFLSSFWCTTERAFATNNSPTDVVETFYKVILQSSDPTLKQERDLFDDQSGLRAALLESTKAPATEPIILQEFKKHKDLFLPIGFKTLSEIQLSSEFTFIRSLERVKDKGDRTYVIALFVNDRKAAHAQFRTVIFEVVDGKINPDAIHLNGFEGALTLDYFLSNRDSK